MLSVIVDQIHIKSRGGKMLEEVGRGWCLLLRKELREEGREDHD